MRLLLSVGRWEMDVTMGRVTPQPPRDEPPMVDEKRGDIGGGPGFGFAYKDDPINSE